MNGHLGYSQGKKTRENQYYLSESIRDITDKIPLSYFTSTDVSGIKAGSILFSSNGLKIEKQRVPDERIQLSLSRQWLSKHHLCHEIEHSLEILLRKKNTAPGLE